MKKVLKKSDKSKVLLGPSESMSKSKKNTIDPETMINQYSADAVRWFILSDSPPEKDVQWSDTGVVSSNKFLQKIWNLNQTILARKDVNKDTELEDSFEVKLNLFFHKIDNAIQNFQFNVAIANFYEVYRYFVEIQESNVSNEILVKNLVKLMKLMTPFVPHLARECLSKLKIKDVHVWPTIDMKKLDNVKINMVIQINGKTRDVISVKKGEDEAEIKNINKLC